VPTATNGTARITINAPPALVYELVSDITRMGEWSPECYRAAWLTHPPGPVVGARFVGHNKLGLHRWRTTCVVTAADPGRQFAFTVVGKHDRKQTLWRYQLTATEAGTLVAESYEFLWCPLRNRIGELPFPRDRHLHRGLQQTLRRLKSTAELDESIA
jgi:uncharacterized protein YndB with AHSA1/START domain